MIQKARQHFAPDALWMGDACEPTTGNAYSIRNGLYPLISCQTVATNFTIVDREHGGAWSGIKGSTMMGILAFDWWTFFKSPLQGIVQWGGVALLTYIGVLIKPHLHRTIDAHRARLKRFGVGLWFVINELWIAFAMFLAGALIYTARHGAPTGWVSYAGVQWTLLGLAAATRIWSAVQYQSKERAKRWQEIWKAQATPEESRQVIKTVLEAAPEFEGPSAAVLASVIRIGDKAMRQTEPWHSRWAEWQIAWTIAWLWFALYLALVAR